MNGENHAIFFKMGWGGGGGAHIRTVCEFIRLKRLVHKQWLSLRLVMLDKNQCSVGVLQVRFEADITARASLVAALWCSPVLASVRLELNRPCIHLGTD